MKQIFKGIQAWSFILAIALILSGETVFGQETATKPTTDGGQETTAKPATGGQQDMGKLGSKLSNPSSDVWALFSEFDLTFSDGDVNQGDAKVGGRMIFQPVLPLPLYGEGDAEWKLITRPTVPVIFSTPAPTGFDQFDNYAGIGDIQLPTAVVTPKSLTGDWSFGLGPTWLLPTASRRELSKEQWGVGPAVLTVYDNGQWLAGTLLQYTWGIGGWNGPDNPDAEYGSLLYFFSYNLPNGWQVGFDPTITYDNNATSGNKWNVPIGLSVSKMVSIGKVPVKFQVGAEYSVVSQDDFGQVFQLKLNKQDSYVICQEHIPSLNPGIV